MFFMKLDVLAYQQHTTLGEQFVPRFLRAFARYIFVAVFSTCALTYGYAQAQTQPEVARGLQWLSGQIQMNGSLLNEPQSIATPLQNRSESAQTLKLLATLPASVVDSIASETENNTEYVARQIISLTLAGRSAAVLAADLTSRQNDNGGFGGAAGYESNALDTAWAMLALRAVNSSNIAAVNYLLTAQDASGGYSVRGNSAQSYVSALVSTALQVASNTPASLDTINKVNAWLLAQQKADGSWGSVAETSIVYLALLGSTSDSGLRNRVTVFLVSQQGSDGSWGGDPYITALALRALIAQPRSVPTTGDIVLHAIGGIGGPVLAGATAVIQGLPSVTATSDATGKITFSSIVAGSYTLIISASGYTSQSLGFSLQAGTTADLGTIAMPLAPTTGILQGTVKDGVTGTALAGVSIVVTGSANANTLTSADGSYSMTGIAPGSITVSASKSGYTSVSGTGTIVAGSPLIFSPGLSPAGQPTGTVGSLTGQVIDATTQVPLAGVAVTIGTGKTATSGVDGRFSVADIAAGTYPVSFNFTGYTAKSIAAVMVSAGSTTDLQIIGLSKALNTVAILGKVTDLNSSQPIAGATVTVLGTTVNVVTDSSGNYHIEGLAPGNATMRFSAVGYTSETVIFSFANPGDFKLDHALSFGQGSSLALSVVTSDQPHYGAYAPATIQIQAQNSGGQPAVGTVGVTILDPQGKVLESLPATWTDSNGVAQRQFEFPVGVTNITMPWNTQANAPGAYAIVARIYQGPAVTSGGAVEIAEKQAELTIDATQAIDSVKLTPLPGFSSLGASEPIHFILDIVNRSNVPVSTNVAYQLRAPSGALVYSASTTVQLLPPEGSKSIVFDGLQYLFVESGSHPASVQLANGSVPATVTANAILVAPGIRIDASQQVAPSIVTPDGDKRIRLDIRLKGVEQK